MPSQIQTYILSLWSLHYRKHIICQMNYFAEMQNAQFHINAQNIHKALNQIRIKNNRILWYNGKSLGSTKIMDFHISNKKYLSNKKIIGLYKPLKELQINAKIQFTLALRNAASKSIQAKILIIFRGLQLNAIIRIHEVDYAMLKLN